MPAPSHGGTKPIHAVPFTKLSYADHRLLVDCGKRIANSQGEAERMGYHWRRHVSSIERCYPDRLALSPSKRYSADLIDDYVSHSLRTTSHKAVGDALRHIRQIYDTFYRDVDLSRLNYRIELLGSPSGKSRRRRTIPLDDLPPRFAKLIEPLLSGPPLNPNASYAEQQAFRTARRKRMGTRYTACGFWGALERAGVAWRHRPPASLICPDFLGVWRADIGNSDNRHKVLDRYRELSTAMGALVSPAAAAIIDKHAERFRAESSSSQCSTRIDKNEITSDDKLLYDELQILNTSLAKDDLDREPGEPNSVELDRQKPIRDAYRAFQRSLMKHAPEIWRQPRDKRDIKRAVNFYIEDLRLRCRPRTVANHLFLLQTALRHISPNRKYYFLSARIKELRKSDPAAPPKKPDISSKELKDIGAAMLEDAWRRIQDLRLCPYRYCPFGPLAEQFRDGLIIVIFANLPLRVRNLSALVLGISLQRNSRGRYTVVFPPELMKNNRSYFQSLPRAVCKLIDRYLRPLEATRYMDSTSVRELICPSSTSDALWLSRQGGGLHRGSIKRIVPEVIFNRTGQRISTHKFRRILATEAYERDPDSILVSALLSHMQSCSKLHYIDPEVRERRFAGRQITLEKMATQCLSRRSRVRSLAA